jgi:hypothetical protein
MEERQCIWPFVPPDARLKAPSRSVAREGNAILHVCSTGTGRRSSAGLAKLQFFLQTALYGGRNRLLDAV